MLSYIEHYFIPSTYSLSQSSQSFISWAYFSPWSLPINPQSLTGKVESLVLERTMRQSKNIKSAVGAWSSVERSRLDKRQEPHTVTREHRWQDRNQTGTTHCHQLRQGNPGDSLLSHLCSLQKTAQVWEEKTHNGHREEPWLRRLMPRGNHYLLKQPSGQSFQGLCKGHTQVWVTASGKPQVWHPYRIITIHLQFFRVPTECTI